MIEFTQQAAKLGLVRIDGRNAGDLGRDEIDHDRMVRLMVGRDLSQVGRRATASRADTSEVPVLFLTAKGQAEDEVMGHKAGGVDFLRKPVSPQLLFARVAAHLR